MPSTASGRRLAIRREQVRNAISRRIAPSTLPKKPLPRRPLKETRSSTIPVFGTSRFSMPVCVPSQLTTQPRRCISSATARPGMTWPPVPAAITTRLFNLMRGLRA